MFDDRHTVLPRGHSLKPIFTPSTSQSRRSSGCAEPAARFQRAFGPGGIGPWPPRLAPSSWAPASGVLSAHMAMPERGIVPPSLGRNRGAPAWGKRHEPN